MTTPGEKKTTPSIGTKVKITGFKIPGDYDDANNIENEKGYISSFTGKIGTIELVDEDAKHPYSVYFGEDTIIRRCRFSLAELSTEIK